MELNPDEHFALVQVVPGVQAALLLLVEVERDIDAVKVQIDRAGREAAVLLVSAAERDHALKPAVEHVVQNRVLRAAHGP